MVFVTSSRLPPSHMKGGCATWCSSFPETRLPSISSVISITPDAAIRRFRPRRSCPWYDIGRHRLRAREVNTQGHIHELKFLICASILQAPACLQILRAARGTQLQRVAVV